MTRRDQILAILRGHSDELHARGIAHLSLFGSVARGDSHARSDIDLLADFDVDREPSLLAFSNLQNHLSEILDAQADLSAAEWLKEQIRPDVLQQAIRVF